MSAQLNTTLAAPRLSRGLRLCSWSWANAANTDAQRLSDWIGGGEKGTRPESVRPALEEKVAELQREGDALIRASTDVMAQKAEYVERHRARLAKDARRHVEKAAGHLGALIAELEDARDELASTREAELWALTYPNDTASLMPPLRQLAGGLQRVGEQLGVAESINVDRVFAALRSDSEWLKDAATPQQKAEIDSVDQRKPGLSGSTHRSTPSKTAGRGMRRWRRTSVSGGTTRNDLGVDTPVDPGAAPCLRRQRSRRCVGTVACEHPTSEHVPS
jgi:hypothetical protein